LLDIKRFSSRVETEMRIAQIAPLMESVPPKLYGGTERIVSYLTEELVKLGHDVTLFASGDSVTSAKLVSCVPTALRLDPKVCDIIPYYMLMLDRVRRQSHQFDILHFHMDYVHFPLFRDMSSRVLTTLHGRQDLPDNKPIYIGFDEMPLISISDSQRIPISNANFVATIYHGIPGTDLKPALWPQGGYLAFLGRIAPEKGPETAIQIARSAGLPLKIAAKIDRVDEQYFRERIAPLLDQPGIEFIGEINEHQKADFLGRGRGFTVSDRLAGTIRLGDDRSNGMRYSSSGFQSRLGIGDRGGRQDRYCGQVEGRGGQETTSPPDFEPTESPARVRAAFFGSTNGK
jgi:glycosyltransferase involved in cell wall biosynthesis